MPVDRCMKSVLSAAENRRVGQAMLDYSMLADNDRVLVAVSGGIDSLALAWILHNWRKKAPINYDVQVVHVDMAHDSEQAGQSGRSAHQVARRLEQIGLGCVILPADLPAPTSADMITVANSTKNICFKCARSRRNQLFDYARKHQYTTIALGHHRDDIVETFFLNLTCSGNISAMRPKQELFAGRLALIRPMAYLHKKEISAIGKRLGLQPVPSSCPLSGQTRRSDIRELLDIVYDRIPGSREQVFAALSNVRIEYLLQQRPQSAGNIHANKS